MSKNQWSGRNFLFTLNEIDRWDELKEYIINHPQFQYAIATLEKAPSTGHKHIHCYVQMKNKTKISKEKTANCRIDPCKGSAQQNINYIKKVDEPEKRGEIIWEEGTPKHKGGPTIKEIKEMPKEDREELPAMYFNIVNKVNQEEAKQLKGTEMFKEMKVYWYWGASGAGKTKAAYEAIGDRVFNEVKFDGNFWHGASEQTQIALYDDFRDSDMKPRELINFIDYNKHIMNVKGGSMRNQYSEIYITSIQDPRGIYPNVEGEPREQWLRRITEIKHFDDWSSLGGPH